MVLESNRFRCSGFYTLSGYIIFENINVLLSGCWLAVWLSGWLLVGRLAGWMGVCLAGWLAGWVVDWMAGWLARLDSCWLDAWKLETLSLDSRTLDALKRSAD